MAARAAAFQTRLEGQGPQASRPPASSDDGEGLRKYILNEYKRGEISAKAACAIAYHATKGGCVGVADLAVDPNQPGRHFADHLVRAVGARAASSFYTAEIPMWDHEKQQRRMTAFPVNFPHEQFAAAYKERPSDFDVANSEADLPPLYHTHPVTKKFKEKSVPIGYFSDAVRFLHSTGVRF